MNYDSQLVIIMPREQAVKLLDLEEYLRKNTDYSIEQILMYFADNKEVVIEVLGGAE